MNNALAFAMICFGVGNLSLYEIVGGGTVYYVIYAIAAVIFITAFVEAYFTVFKRRKKTIIEEITE